MSSYNQVEYLLRFAAPKDSDGWRISVDYAGVASPELSGTAASGGALTNQKPMELQVQYHCSARGAAIVMIRFPMLPTGTLTFSVVKVYSIMIICSDIQTKSIMFIVGLS